MELVRQVQILDETACISFCAYTLGKSMKPSVLLPQTMGKIVGTIVFSSLVGKQAGLGKEKKF